GLVFWRPHYEATRWRDDHLGAACTFLERIAGRLENRARTRPARVARNAGPHKATGTAEVPATLRHAVGARSKPDLRLRERRCDLRELWHQVIMPWAYMTRTATYLSGSKIAIKPTTMQHQRTVRHCAL